MLGLSKPSVRDSSGNRCTWNTVELSARRLRHEDPAADHSPTIVLGMTIAANSPTRVQARDTPKAFPTTTSKNTLPITIPQTNFLTVLPLPLPYQNHSISKKTTLQGCLLFLSSMPEHAKLKENRLAHKLIFTSISKSLRQKGFSFPFTFGDHGKTDTI